MKQSFYIYNNGDLKRKDNTLQFTNQEGEKRDIPIERISDIYVMSEMSFNTKFLNYVAQYGIPVHFFNYYNFYTGSFYPRESLLAGQLLVRQVEHYTEYEKRLEIAHKFIEAAADNIYRNLRYYKGRWSHVFKTCKKYLHHIQDSVFEGEITNVQLAQLHQELKQYVDRDLDSVIIFKSRQERWLDKEFWGKEDDMTSFLL